MIFGFSEWYSEGAKWYSNFPNDIQKVSNDIPIFRILFRRCQMLFKFSECYSGGVECYSDFPNDIQKVSNVIQIFQMIFGFSEWYSECVKCYSNFPNDIQNVLNVIQIFRMLFRRCWMLFRFSKCCSDKIVRANLRVRPLLYMPFGKI